MISDGELLYVQIWKVPCYTLHWSEPIVCLVIKFAQHSRHKKTNQTRQFWSNIHQDSVTGLPICCLKSERHFSICLSLNWELLWPGFPFFYLETILNTTPNCNMSLVAMSLFLSYWFLLIWGQMSLLWLVSGLSNCIWKAQQKISGEEPDQLTLRVWHEGSL